MILNVGGITLSSNHPETVCQAYHAGQLYSMVEAFLPKEVVPPFVHCMTNFPALRELFGERLWQKLKSHSKFRARVLLYEQLTYQPGLPKLIIGGPKEFCIGYTYNHVRTKAWRTRAISNRDDVLTITDYLSKV